VVRVSLHHSTRYAFDRNVAFAPHLVRLRPAPHTRTPIEAYSLKIGPLPHFLNWQQDPFGNFQARLVFPEPAPELVVQVDLVANLIAVNPFDFFLEECAEKLPVLYQPELVRELLPYFHTLALEPKLAALVELCRARFALAGRRSMDVLVDINQHLQRVLRYDIRMEPGVFSPEQTLALGHGSCRDFAWLQCQLLRHLGFATRFASGYSIQLRPDEKPVFGPAGVSQDVADLHAWTEVFLPGAGWVGLDATSGLLAGEGHIPLACTPEPGSAAPVTGSFAWDKHGEDEKLGEDFSFVMTVARIAEEPRSTKPYSEEVWSDIEQLGHAVDQVLERDDVRLSMGGEPTFVYAADADAPEWNTTALGGAKFRVADTLTRRLRQRFAPGGLLFHGQGKWYPGEPLPRWSVACHFRKDGQPIWQDVDLIVAEDGPHRRAGTAEADVFIRALATHLGVGDEHIRPGHEDAWYYLWRERKLPVNVDPLCSHLEDEVERKRLAQVFESGLGAVVGYALPLSHHACGWRSGPWFLRRERLYLVPGDSPMGFRLPLDSLPWVASSEREDIHDPDPLVRRLPLPSRVMLQSSRSVTELAAAEPAPGSSAAGLVRTALCAEPRNGVLHVFLPPLPSVEAFLELTAAIEATAAQLAIPVRLEGYPPLPDPRLSKFELTPDPGVLEVNIHPSTCWSSLCDVTTTLYEEARAVGLSTEKFDFDGRHSGTGGGNHITLGGHSPADSPLLRRPDLLRSLLTYWNNHPSLSYLFSGLFIGPTSQAPRIDEARQDALAELEIAFAQIEPFKACPPWLVDRLFRHLLVDVTGNTHRAEMCIDKLYNPDVASGRQGLVELRNFEMPPHARMSLAQLQFPLTLDLRR
jgi:transglutaminase-like putative cysteine protease